MTSDVNDLAVSAITIKTFAASNSPEHRVAAKTQNAFKRAELIHFKRQRQQELIAVVLIKYLHRFVEINKQLMR